MFDIRTSRHHPKVNRDPPDVGRACCKRNSRREDYNNFSSAVGPDTDDLIIPRSEGYLQEIWKERPVTTVQPVQEGGHQEVGRSRFHSFPVPPGGSGWAAEQSAVCVCDAAGRDAGSTSRLYRLMHVAWRRRRNSCLSFWRRGTLAAFRGSGTAASSRWC